MALQVPLFLFGVFGECEVLVSLRAKCYGLLLTAFILYLGLEFLAFLRGFLYNDLLYHLQVGAFLFISRFNRLRLDQNLPFMKKMILVYRAEVLLPREPRILRLA
jgi:hypothetical protein